MDIDDDVLAVAKEISRKQGISAGQVISRLLREALIGNNRVAPDSGSTVGGFRPFPARGTVVSDELIDKLRDQEGL
ncbi:MAG: hypothetical protein ACU843_18975 [Gammaproteobacteria bacterium]